MIRRLAILLLLSAGLAEAQYSTPTFTRSTQDTSVVSHQLRLAFGAYLHSPQATSTFWGGWTLDTTLAYNRTNITQLLKSNFGGIFAPVGMVIQTLSERAASSVYVQDALTDHTNFRPYLTVTAPHSLLQVQRVGPRTYSAGDNIGAVNGVMITNSQLATQAALVKGINGWVAVGYGHPAGIYAQGGANVPPDAVGVFGQVHQYASGKVPQAAGVRAQIETLGSTGGYRRAAAMHAKRTNSMAYNDTTVGMWVDSPPAGSGYYADIYIESDSAQIALNDLKLKRTAAGELAIGAGRIRFIDGGADPDTIRFTFPGGATHDIIE